eukprot:gene12488-13771_t
MADEDVRVRQIVRKNLLPGLTPQSVFGRTHSLTRGAARNASEELSIAGSSAEEHQNSTITTYKRFSSINVAKNQSSEAGLDARIENNAAGLDALLTSTQEKAPTSVALDFEDLKKSIAEQVLAAISAQLPARTSLAGRKRPLPVVDEAVDNVDDTLSVHAHWPLGHRAHSESDVDSLTGNLPEENSSVARGTKQCTSKTENMSDLFPAKSATSASSKNQTKVLDVAEDLLCQVDDEISDTTLGDEILDNLADRICKHFVVDPTKVSSDLLGRLKLPKNCSGIVVPMMNQTILDMKDFESIRPVERKLYNTQLNVQRATAAIAKIANMVLEADQNSKMIDSKALLRAALDGVTVLGQAQASLTNSRKNNIKQILSDDVKDICNPKRKASQYLFGDDLPKLIKEARDLYRMSNNIGNKKPQSKHPSTRGSHTATRPNNTMPQRMDKGLF